MVFYTEIISITTVPVYMYVSVPCESTVQWPGDHDDTFWGYFFRSLREYFLAIRYYLYSVLGLCLQNSWKLEHRRISQNSSQSYHAYQRFSLKVWENIYIMFSRQFRIFIIDVYVNNIRHFHASMSKTYNPKLVVWRVVLLNSYCR